MSRAPTSDQLRYEIDSGAAGDKVAEQDPSMAPLGTDDEAAGHAPTRTERIMAARAEIAPILSEPRSVLPKNFPILYLTAAVPAAVTVLLALYLALRQRNGL